jgi:hypothetical protein
MGQHAEEDREEKMNREVIIAGALRTPFPWGALNYPFSGLNTKLYVADALNHNLGDRFRSTQILNLVAPALGRKSARLVCISK